MVLDKIINLLITQDKVNIELACNLIISQKMGHEELDKMFKLYSYNDCDFIFNYRPSNEVLYIEFYEKKRFCYAHKGIKSSFYSVPRRIYIILLVTENETIIGHDIIYYYI